MQLYFDFTKILYIISDMFVLLLFAAASTAFGSVQADVSWRKTSREGLQSVREFCSGRGPLDTAEDLFSSSFGKHFASSWSGTEARPNRLKQSIVLSPTCLNPLGISAHYVMI